MPFGKEKPVTFALLVADDFLGPGANAEFDATDFQVAWTSMVHPETTESVEPREPRDTALKVQQVPTYAREQYDTTRLEVTAEDGGEIPGVAGVEEGHAAGRLGSALPARLRRLRLYDYGGASDFERRRSWTAAWCWPEAHLRGGGDFGKPWHDAGRMMNKKNTFTDFIACAEGRGKRSGPRRPSSSSTAPARAGS